MDFFSETMSFGDDVMKYGFYPYNTSEGSNSLDEGGLSATFSPDTQLQISRYLEDMLEHEQGEQLNIYDESYVARSQRLTSDPLPSLTDDLTDIFPMSAASSSGISSGGSSPDPNSHSDHLPSPVTTHHTYHSQPYVPFNSTSGGVMVSNTGNSYQIPNYTMAAGMIYPTNSFFGAVQPQFQFQAQPLSNPTPLYEVNQVDPKSESATSTALELEFRSIQATLGHNFSPYPAPENTVTFFNENQSISRRFEVLQPGTSSSVSAILIPRCTPAKPKRNSGKTVVNPRRTNPDPNVEGDKPRPKNHRCTRMVVCKSTQQQRICGKAFYDPSSLILHDRTHTGLRPFRCDYLNCGHRAKQVVHIQKHYRDVHKMEISVESAKNTEVGRLN